MVFKGGLSGPIDAVLLSSNFLKTFSMKKSTSIEHKVPLMILTYDLTDKC